MSFNTVLDFPETGFRFWVEIGGIPYIFLDGPVPEGLDGTTWSAPTSKTHAYTLLPKTVDARRGITDIGAEVDRATAQVSSGSLDLFLNDTHDEDLLALFATRKDTGNVAILSGDVNWSNHATQELITEHCGSWASTGFAYHGLETIYYGANSGTRLSSLTRDVFSVGDADGIYRHNTAKPSGPAEIADYPLDWQGRYVRVFAFAVAHDGRALDSAFYGDHSREVYRGVIHGMPRNTPDWYTWRIQTVSIESILQTEVGREVVRGQMLQIPGNAKQNAAGAQGDVPGVPGQKAFMYLDANNSRVHCLVKEWADAATKAASGAHIEHKYLGDQALDLLGGGSPRVVSVNQLQDLWRTEVSDTFLAATGELTSHIEKKATWVLGLSNPNGVSAKVFEVTFYWSREDSFGRVFDLTDDASMLSATTSVSGVYSLGTADPVVLSVPATATVIPFYYEATQGTIVETPLTTGYAVIGDGADAEIVSYTGIESLSDQTTIGLYQLTGVGRGRMGTVAKAVSIRASEVQSASTSAVIRFGIGLEDVSVGDAILQLAISTGAAHHGDYDTLAEGVSVGLCPGHFDLEQWAASVAAMTVDERTIAGVFIDKPVKLSELATDLLQPIGRFVYAATNADGEYLIQLGEVLPPLLSSASQVIDASGLDYTDPADFQDVADRAISEVLVHHRWNPVDHEPVKGATITVKDSSGHARKNRKTIEWTLVGYDFDAGTAMAVVQSWAQQVFQRFGRPYSILRLTTGRAGWLLNPGSVVQLTMPAAPNQGGTRGYEADYAVCLRVSKTYTGPDVGAEVIVALEPPLRYSTYCPCARIAAYNPAGPTITLEDYGFSPTNGPKVDADFFADGFSVWIYETEGDASSRVQRSLSGKTGATFTLSSALGFTPTSDSYLTFADWGSVTAEQRKHAYIASNASPPLLGGSAEAFRYV